MAELLGPQTNGLVLSGGGARAAYQLGALSAMAEILPSGHANPFPIICGTSAGAINAAMLAIHADEFSHAVVRLRAIWETLSIHDVYHSDLPAVAHSIGKWLHALAVGRHAPRRSLSLLDNQPLRQLIAKELDFSRLPGHIASGTLSALAINATSYTSGRAVTFFQGGEHLSPWTRSRRLGVATTLGVDHVMASLAIPFIFPAARVGEDYYADGSMRQLAPLSPALHLGAKRILVIAVGQLAAPQDTQNHDAALPPTLAHIAGYALTSIFLDNLSADLERLQHLNRLVNLVPPHRLAEHGFKVGHIDALVLSPQRSIAPLALQHAQRLPRAMRLLLRGLGSAHGGGANFLSYLLFDREFCRNLIDMGYEDAMSRRDEIEAFLGGASASFIPLFPPELR